jgi:hypothetical protein
MDAHVDDFVDRVADRLACTRCLRDATLRATAADAGFDAACDYCGREGTCVDVAWIADGVHGLVQSAFVRAAPDAPGTVDSLALVTRATRFDVALARDVHAQLARLHRDDDGEALYGDACRYVAPVVHAPFGTWRALDSALVRARDGDAQTRALDAFKWAFAALDELRTAKGRAVVRTWRAGTRMHAATLAEVDDTDHGAGLMIAASDARTALAECRPLRGLRVELGRWRPTRDLRVLDVDALCKTLARTSGFAADGWNAHARATFLRGWRDALRRGAADAAHGGATPLRLALDWLAHGPSPRLDGVETRSGYGSGRTLVLFATAMPALVPGRRRCVEVDGIRIGYRRLEGSTEVARGLADADREQRDDAETGHDDEFHGSPP